MDGLRRALPIPYHLDTLHARLRNILCHFETLARVKYFARSLRLEKDRWMT